MRSILFATVLLFGAVSGAQAAPPVPKCIRTIDIDRTSTPDDKTILFHLHGGTVLRSDLKGTCSGLRFNGFAYDASPQGQLCADLDVIHVLHTHAVCALGPFMDATPPPPPHM